MRIHKCFFCSANVYPGHGVLFVRNDCKEFRFCRSKCHRAFKKKWNPRRTKWTKAYRKSVGKELAVDPIYSFERVVNEPTMKATDAMYEKTVEAIRTIEEVRGRRETHYYNDRFYGEFVKKLPKIDKEIDRNQRILNEEVEKSKKVNKNVLALSSDIQSFVVGGKEKNRKIEKSHRAAKKIRLRED